MREYIAFKETVKDIYCIFYLMNETERDEISKI